MFPRKAPSVSGADVEGGQAQPLWLIKWGGGLLTDKREPESLDLERLDRLCRELVAGCAGSETRVVLGHGSGSFGHWSAKDSFLRDPERSTGRLTTPQLAAVAATADAASRLHRHVVKGLLEVGLFPFSWLPSSALFEDHEGKVVESRPVVEALARGLLPVTMGDVVLSRRHGARIWSTERVLEELSTALRPHGHRVERVLWLGKTDGILDGSGQTMDVVDGRRPEDVIDCIGGSDGVDVTGGMRLRFEACCRLAEQGIESWILDGRKPLVLQSALGGVRLGGTRMPALAGFERSSNLS